MGTFLTRNKTNNSQARVPQIKKPRSVFPFKFYRKQTMKCSYLTPILCEEVLPGDTWIINMTSFNRLATQLVPTLDTLWVKTYWFFNPYRILWNNFTKQHGERENPDDSIDYITPSITAPAGGFGFKTLYDYLEMPPDVGGYKVSALMPRAYNKIYNQYFRSERLQNSIYENNTDSDDAYDKFVLQRIGKMHDYFTDCLPDLQLGEPVSLPLGTKADVWGYQTGSSFEGNLLKLTPEANNNGISALNSYFAVKGDTSNNLEYYRMTRQDSDDGTVLGSATKMGIISKEYANSTGSGGTWDKIDNSGLYADLSNATAATITALRNAIDLQTLLERDNRNGTRYTELLQARYGAINPDLRMMRPQYLGGTSTPLVTTPVVQSSGTGTSGQNTPQGNLAGYGQVGDKGRVVKASFGEFGCILGLAVIQAVPQYQQGIHRKHTRFTRFDYYYPEFAGLSDQAVLNKEIYVQGTNKDNEVFGYIPRFDEYRYFNNHICGELRSTYSQSLDVWHYAEKFENLPKLNDEFIQDKAVDIVPRGLAVQYEGETETPAEQIIAGFEFKGTVTRVMPAKGEPITGGRIF